MELSQSGSGLMVVTSNFDILSTANLSPIQTKVMNYLRNFEAPYLKEKLLHRELFTSPDEYEHVFIEYKKFMGLTQVANDPLGMMSEAVDNVWHQHILFTKDYHEFSDRIAGHYIHHSPQTKEQPLPEGIRQRTIEVYNKVFGELDPIWDVNSKAGVECCEGCGSSCNYG